ncbi:universal stress protein [Bizionia sediminis]|uniref:Universal stress protein n=1 Tax=Bizionia sediminis TaxID=1737064 RepID=A0ABW5KTR9_9FLAO
MKRIILPTDFSANSKHAMSYALQFFSNETCHFYLLHSYEPVAENMNHMQISAATFNVEKSAKALSEEKLHALQVHLEQLNNNPKHSFETVASFNILTDEVNYLADTKKCDYVVMGTKGATGAKEILFGSNTVQVFKKAPCPVMAIPEVAVYTKPEQVLFPTDFEIPYTTQMLQPVLEITTNCNAQLHVLHVASKTALTTEQNRQKLTLQKLLKPLVNTFHEVEETNVSAAILSFQETHSTDMLIMIQTKKSFFESLFFTSTIHHIGHHITKPFLVIPVTL